MCTIHPARLLIDPEKWPQFLEQLAEERVNLEMDKRLYLDVEFPVCSDLSEMGLCVRFAYHVTWLAFTRFHDNIDHIFTRHGSRYFTRQQVHAYFAHTCIPPTATYHPTEAGQVCSDIIRRIFQRGVECHVADLGPGDVVPLNDTCNRNACIYDSGDGIEELLQFIAHICSFPVVPEDIGGRSVVTLQDPNTATQFTFLQPGADNVSRESDLADTRVCLACKCDTLSLGLTDVAELNNKYKCSCLYDKIHVGGLFEKVYIARATAITRVLLLNKRLIPQGLGCSCPDHTRLFTNCVARMRAVLKTAGVLAE